MSLRMMHQRRPVIVMLLLATVVCIVTSLPASMNLPLVDPGLFVISGVKTCGDSSGYCLLGSDCTTDDDFLPDPSGNCEGLKRAFTPSAPFVCCKFNRKPLQTDAPITDIKKVNSTEFYKNKLTRNTRENIDSSKMDGDQLTKLNQIESVIKKIIEQLIKETANNIKSDETMIVNGTEIEENTNRYDLREEIPMFNDSTEIPMDSDNTEIKESTMNPLTKMEETIENGKQGTEIPPENKEETETNNSDTFEPEETIIDDDFKAEKKLCQKTCKSDIIFIVDKKPVCYGTLLDDIWILTSATCASRLNKANIRKVVASRKDLAGVTLNISNILVHENFKSPSSKNSPEYNDLALVSLTLPLQDEECVPCFNHKKNITNEVCKSSQNNNFKSPVKSTDNCEGQVQQRDLMVNSYLILPCHRWRMQYNQEGRLGSGLWCDGKLAGVQTGVGVGSLIYTPVNEYAEWISDNKRYIRQVTFFVPDNISLPDKEYYDGGLDYKAIDEGRVRRTDFFKIMM